MVTAEIACSMLVLYTYFPVKHWRHHEPYRCTITAPPMAQGHHPDGYERLLLQRRTGGPP